MRSVPQPIPIASAASAPAPVLRTPHSALRAAEVFSINFLRHETLPLSLRRTLLSFAVVYLIIQIAIAIALVAAAFAYGRDSFLTQRRLADQSPASPSVKSLRKDMQAVSASAEEELAQLNHFLALQRQQFPVGSKLAALTKTLPPRTWITELIGSRERRALTIRAAYFVDPNDPHALPTKAWLEGLTQDPVFGQGLKRLELGASSRKTQGRAEVFTFELLAEWNP